MKDIVYTRKYTDQKGQERKEYVLVGYLFEKDGKTSILMKPWINVSALTNDKGEVWLSVYEHKSKTNTNTNNTKEEQLQKETLAVSEPTVELVTQVVNEGKEYAKKWEEMSKSNNPEDDIPF